MKPRVYVETSVISYLTSRPSENLRNAERGVKSCNATLMPSYGTRSPANTVYVLRLRQVTAHNSPHEARVYVETSVISYLTNRPALDVITAGHQATTYKMVGRATIKLRSRGFAVVLDEAAGGDPVAAAKRVATLVGIARLNVQRPEISRLAQTLLAQRALPQKAFVDALHGNKRSCSI